MLRKLDSIRQLNGLTPSPLAMPVDMTTLGSVLQSLPLAQPLPEVYSKQTQGSQEPPVVTPEADQPVALEKVVNKPKQEKEGKSRKVNKKYPCLIEGCGKELTSKDNLWDHMIGCHTTIRYIHGKAKTLQQIGEAILGQQKSIQCLVDGCMSNPFDSFESLGRHLQKPHRTELDKQPFNKVWKQQLVTLGYISSAENAEMDDQALYEWLDTKNTKRYLYLSQMKGHFLGKKYQTRHGKGIFCLRCQTEGKEVKINRSPEGIGQHWHAVHSTDRYECKVCACGGDAETVASFKFYRDFLEHLRAGHKSLTKDELQASVIREVKTEEGVAAQEELAMVTK